MQLRNVIEKAFQKLGYTIIHFNNKPSANGVDCWVQNKGRRPLSVEIKRVRKHQKGQLRVDPVSKPRRNDDLIAIVINPEYVLIEPMKDHLMACSNMGTRQLTVLGGYDGILT